MAPVVRSADGTFAVAVRADTLRQVAATFLDEFGVLPQDVRVVVVHLDAVATALGVELDRGGQGAVVFAVGDFELAGVGPPGAEPVKGRTAVGVISDSGVMLGGGLLTEDVSKVLDPGSSAIRLSELLDGGA